jgi:hypothetical protein
LPHRRGPSARLGRSARTVVVAFERAGDWQLADELVAFAPVKGGEDEGAETGHGGRRMWCSAVAARPRFAPRCDQSRLTSRLENPPF